MNVEMQRAKLDSNISVDTSQAKENRNKGDSHISTSCIMCKCKPNCNNAIPYYKLAAEAYQAGSKFEDELYCRQKLIYCYQFTKSVNSEANEHESIAHTYLIHLNKKEEAFKEIQNAFECFRQVAKYADGMNCLKNISDKFIERNDYEYAEKCLRIGYDSLILTFHILSTQRDSGIYVLYDVLFMYLNVLYRNNNIPLAIKSCETAITTIEPFGTEKSKLVELYATILLTFVLTNNDNDFKTHFDLVKRHCTTSHDSGLIGGIEAIFYLRTKYDENQFKMNMISANSRCPRELTKKIYEMFNSIKDKQKNEFEDLGLGEDDHVVVVNEDDDFR